MHVTSVISQLQAKVTLINTRPLVIKSYLKKIALSAYTAVRVLQLSNASANMSLMFIKESIGSCVTFVMEKLLSTFIASSNI